MRVHVYENGDLGVGDAADLLIRLKPGDAAHAYYLDAIRRGAATATHDLAPPPLEALGLKVHEHGELGPVLTDPAHDFTGPSDL